MPVIDLIPELEAVVRQSRTEIEFKAKFWSWLNRQRKGPLGPLLSDMVRLWSGTGSGTGVEEARKLLRRLSGVDRVARAGSVLARYTEISGHGPDPDVILLAGLRRPEGYSRFDRGRNTIFISLDHPNALAHADHFEVILAHELTHAVRDPTPAVLADYGGSPEMTHDDFVERHPFREHLVSEALATSVSERAYPGIAEPRYIFFDRNDHAWCESHRGPIAARMLQALRDADDYDTFYARGVVAPDAPDCCDYYFGYHLGRFALEHAPAGELLVLPASAFLERYLDPFLDRFLGRTTVQAATAGAPMEQDLAPSVLPASVRAFYADLAEQLTTRPAEALAAAAAFRDAVRGPGLDWNGKPYDVLDFPLVLSTGDLRYLRWVTEHLLRTVEKVVARYRRDPELRAYYGFPAHLEQLALVDPGYASAVPIARFDSYWNGKRVRFLELNANGTAGFVLADRLGPLYLEDPAAGRLAARHLARGGSILEPLLDTLLGCWREAAAALELESAQPRVAIVDWRGLATASELAAIREALDAAGIEALVLDPAELDYDGRRLTAHGLPLDLVYRRLTIVDIMDPAPSLQPLLDACRDRRVAVVGPFSSDIAHSKRLFAVLTHERWRDGFTMDERALIDAHVPWTRMFRPERTLRGGRVHDLRELALAEREQFVLKPAEGADGRDVVLGLELTPAQWEKEVARRYGRDHVIQERVDAPVRTFLVPRETAIEAAPLNLHLGEYMLGGKLAGFLARASSRLVLSSTSDDRSIPCLVLEDEPDEERAAGLSRP